MKNYSISNQQISIEELSEILGSEANVELSAESIEKVEKCRNYLDQVLAQGNRVIYGINTGFGSLCNTIIPNEDLEKLQENLVMSHACGMGDEVPRDIVKIMLLLKAIGLSKGHSGVQKATIDRLLFFYNNEILPVVFQQGSLGASGDLAPLAHMSLPLIHKGKVYVNGVKKNSEDMESDYNIEPIVLRAKEGLALLNGTQFMSSYGAWILIKAQKLSKLADLIAALSVDAFEGHLSPFTKEVNEIRNQEGQIETARVIRTYLEGSEIMQGEKKSVQDPYSFRCVPQVHGASKDAINHAKVVFEREMNAVTDNPTIFPDEDLVVSAGNFHGQPLAVSLDLLGIALAELGNISERRTYQLIGGNRDLPVFLVAEPGINSGYMIPQYTAASIVSQNKQLATPASIDSIESSNGQEDHVSMGANAATKCYQIVNNLEKILAIELMNAAQALEFRRPKKSSPIIEKFVADYRSKVAFTKEDEYLHPKMMATVDFLNKYEF
ncbi:MAG: histidine ammonia-lyase [Crocinitomicaceae bacterium]